MKKLTAILSLILAVCLLCSMTVYAESAERPGEPVMIDINDVTMTETDRQEDFTLTVDGEPVLIVEHVEQLGVTAALSDVAANGYYTADFALPDSTRQVFLTGLTNDNVAEIESAIVEAYAYGGDFTLTDLGFIDAEKTSTEDNDDYMCWAAATSNILAYTGWGAQAGFNNSDDLFELFISSYENQGGHSLYGLGWFFNGVDTFRSEGGSSAPAKVLDYPNSGAYLTDYPYDEFAETLELQDAGAAGLMTLEERMRDGYGAALSLEIYENGEQQAAHAVTCWGFVTDTVFSADEKAHYDSIFITDSDSAGTSSDRRLSHDEMCLYALSEVYQAPYYDTFSFNYDPWTIAVLRDVVTLAPYRDGLAPADTADATHNRTANPDLLIDTMALSSSSTDTESFITQYPVGSNVYFYPRFFNESDVNYVGAFKLTILLTDSTGRTVRSDTLDAGYTTIYSNNWISFYDPIQLATRLPEGDYTFSLSVNANHSVQEAYFYNNTYTVKFRVGEKESYLVGDVDNDADVSSLDVTWILRISAGLATNLDDRAEIRGDVTGDGDMEIIDATYLQRWLADLPVPIDTINTTQYYD